MLRRLLAFILILATFLSSTGFLGFLSLGSKPVIDPVLVPAADVALPSTPITDLGDGFVLTFDQNTLTASVIDLRSGRTKQVKTRRQDRDTWASIVYANAIGRFGRDAEILLAKLDRDPDNPPVISHAFRQHASRCRYGECYTGLTQALLDRETATLLPLPNKGGDFIGVTAWEQLLYMEKGPDGYTLRLCSIDGKELHAVTLPLDEYASISAFPLEDGLLLLHKNQDKETMTLSASIMVLDRELNAGPAIEMGDNFSLLDFRNPHQSAKHNLILMPSMRLGGILMYNTEKGQWHILTEGDAGVRTDALTTETLARLQSLYGSMSTLNVAGMSSDGSFALITSMYHGLYKLDLETLTLTQPMDEAALESIGLNSFTAAYLSWDGGEFVVDPSNVFRLEYR